MYVAFEMSRITRRTLTALALAWCAARSTAPLAGQQTDTLQRGPLQRAAAVFVRIDSAVHAQIGHADSTAPLQLTDGCQFVRGTLLSVAAYQGYRVGSMTELTVKVWKGPGALVLGAEAIGAAASVLWVMNEPLPRRLPLCPSSLHTLSGRPPNPVTVCRASEVTTAMIEMSHATVAAIGLAPVVTVVDFLRGRSGDVRSRDRRRILIGLPLAGAGVGVFEAQHRAPCRRTTAQRA